MAKKLKNMQLSSVDLVREGANQEADICLFKGMSPSDGAEHPPEDIYKNAITESIKSILTDNTLTEESKNAMILKSIEQYHDAMVDLAKFNPYHGADGRFASASGATSFTYAPGKSKAHDLAIQREKERQSATASGAAKYDNDIDSADSLDALDRIVESAANDDSLTNDEYTAIYDRALRRAQSWDPALSGGNKKSAGKVEDFNEVRINRDYYNNRTAVSSPSELHQGDVYIMRSAADKTREFGTFEYEGTYNTAWGEKYRFRNTVDRDLWWGMEDVDFEEGIVVMAKSTPNHVDEIEEVEPLKKKNRTAP